MVVRAGKQRRMPLLRGTYPRHSSSQRVNAGRSDKVITSPKTIELLERRFGDEVGRVSQKVAAQIAGVSRSEFVSVLSRLQVSHAREYGRGVNGRAATAPTMKPAVLNASPLIILARAGYLDLK